MAKKYICDICGEKCNDDIFILPVINIYETKGGISNRVVLPSFSCLEKTETNLCVNCSKQISAYIELLKETKSKRSKTNE